MQAKTTCVRSDRFLCSCSRRSCSSLSRCSLACLRFSARARAASSGSLVPADGLLAGAAGLEAAAAAVAVAVVVVVVEAAAGEAAASTLGTAGEETDTTGGVEEGGGVSADDTTMAGTLLETKERDAMEALKTN